MKKKRIIGLLLISIVCASGWMSGCSHKENLESHVQSLENRVEDLDKKKKEDEAEQKKIEDAQKKASEAAKKKQEEKEITLTMLLQELEALEEKVEKINPKKASGGNDSAYKKLAREIKEEQKRYHTYKKNLNEHYKNAKNKTEKQKWKKRANQYRKFRARLDNAKEKLDKKFKN